MNSQNRYEAGATEPSASYFMQLAAHDVDILWILTGQRISSTLSNDEADLVGLFNSLPAADRDTVLAVTRSLAGRAAPVAAPLPAPELVQALFEQFRHATPTDDPDELLRELATQLPSILQAAEGAQGSPASDRPATPRAQPADDGDDRRASRRGRRT